MELGSFSVPETEESEREIYCGQLEWIWLQIVLLCLLVLIFLFIFFFFKAASVNSCQYCLFFLLLYFASLFSFRHKGLPVLLAPVFPVQAVMLASFSVILAEVFPGVPAVEMQWFPHVPIHRCRWSPEEGLISVQLDPWCSSCLKAGMVQLSSSTDKHCWLLCGLVRPKLVTT